MDNKSLKRAVAANIAVLTASVLMLAAMSFAWFLSSRTVPAPQSLHMGAFEVTLSDSTGETSAARTLALDAAYPMTQAAAEEAYLAGEKNVYAFEIRNTGSVPAQVRLSAQVVSDSGQGAGGSVLPLSGQMRYAVKFWRNSETKPTTFAGGYLLFGSDNGNKSFKQYFNELFLTQTGGVWLSNSDATLAPKTAELTDTLRFELLIWLDENATVETTGAWTGEGASALPKLVFDVRMHAIQSGGGAAWQADDIADRPAEAAPEVV